MDEIPKYCVKAAFVIGHKRTWPTAKSMSALPPIADINADEIDVAKCEKRTSCTAGGCRPEHPVQYALVC